MADIIKDDFIKRSDALLAAFDLNVRDCSALLNNGIPYQHIKDALLAIKAIDVQPVVHGKWVHLGGSDWCCSACGNVICTEGSWEHPLERGYSYCKHCGARMDGGT